MSYEATHYKRAKPWEFFTFFLLAIFALLPCTSSFAQTDQRSIFASAQRHAKLGNFSEAARLYKQNVDLFQDPFSATNLAMYYLDGMGVQQDSQEAIRLLKYSLRHTYATLALLEGGKNTHTLP